ncbi:hypothetical protein Q9R32_05340 [Actinotalea sp. AC32]|nr:hypothetical protein [Actinotalea sp. AC32]
MGQKALYAIAWLGLTAVVGYTLVLALSALGRLSGLQTTAVLVASGVVVLLWLRRVTRARPGGRSRRE